MCFSYSPALGPHHCLVGVGESIDMTDEDTVYEIADGSFWKRLKRYNHKSAKGAAIGADG